MTTGSDDDTTARLLRAALDQELAPVQADRRLLADVLARPVRRPTRWGWLAAAAAAGALGVAAVLVVPSQDPGTTDRLAGPAPTAATAPATVPPTAPTPTDPPSSATAGCPGQTSDPGGAVVRADLDGDGTDDALTWNGGALHVVLGGGGGEVSSELGTASPYVTALLVRTAGAARRQVLVGTRGAISPEGTVGTVARLYDLRDCVLAPVLGANGRPYDFLVGNQSDTERSGVVCDGRVLYGRTAVLEGGAWRVTDRPVSSADGTAVNGQPRTTTVADGTPEAQALATETCAGEPVTIG